MFTYQGSYIRQYTFFGYVGESCNEADGGNSIDNGLRGADLYVIKLDVVQRTKASGSFYCLFPLATFVTGDPSSK